METPGEPTSPVYLRVKAAGEVTLLSGTLVACDPTLATSDVDGFTVTVPEGRHPVRLCVIEYTKRGKRYDQRVALARVDFAPAPVQRWDLATLPGQSTKKLKRGEYLGFPVESGAACFADLEAARTLGAALETDEDRAAEVLAALDAHYQDTWSWAVVPVGEDPALDAVLFSAGDGEGTYPTFFGYDAKGKLVSALTDFLLISYA